MYYKTGLGVGFTTLTNQTYYRGKALIYVYGTSHVSEQSLELVKEKIEEHNPEIVALELDFMRLNALLNGKRDSSGPIFIKLIQKFQNSIGRKTGVMPGEEMLYGYKKAVNEDRDIALIDQDVRETIKKLKNVRRTEKVKAVAGVLVGLPFQRKFNISEIPEDEFIDRLLHEMKFKFPQLYNVLVEERNTYMSQALKQLQEDNPEEDIVAFVGAAHKRGILEDLEQYEGISQNQLE